MDQDELLHLWKRTRAIALKMGFFEDCDDIAQESVRMILDGASLNRDLSLLVIDAIRVVRLRTHDRKKKIFFSIDQAKEEDLHWNSPVETAYLIREIVKKTADLDQKILILFLLDCNYQEIGTILNLTPQTISKRLRRLMKQTAQELAHDGGLGST